MNKKELDFSLILCNAICDQCNRKYYLMHLFFVHSYVASKIEEKEKYGRESNDEIKEQFFQIID